MTWGLRAFREGFYGCVGQRADALFELCDALLTARNVPSPVPLSLEVVHHWGWGSLYAALSKGSVDAEALTELLASYDLGTKGTTVCAADVSSRPRCDAEASPRRSYLYHASRHLNSGRALYFDPELPPKKRPVGRPYRYGEKFELKDPRSWPEPTQEHHS